MRNEDKYLNAIILRNIITDRNAKNSEFVSNVCFLNVKKQIQNIINQSDILRDLLDKKQIGIIGAIYNFASGQVEFDHQGSTL